MIVDFTEIKTSDDFEFFSNNFLKLTYFNSTTSWVPSRGPDSGRDIILSCPVEYSFSRNLKLVSCKNYAGSNQSINYSIDSINPNRLIEHKCVGQILIYSTMITSSFQDTLLRLFPENGPHSLTIFQPRDIQDTMLSDVKYMNLFFQYFPNSYSRYIGMMNVNKCGSCGHEIYEHDSLVLIHTKNQFNVVQNSPVLCYECGYGLHQHYNDDNIFHEVVFLRHGHELV